MSGERPRYHLHLPGEATASPRSLERSARSGPITYKITVERLDGVGCSEAEALEAMSIYCIEQYGANRRRSPRRRRKGEVLQ